MIQALISPAKTLDFESEKELGVAEAPFFLDQSEKVNRKLRKYSRKKLQQLQSISPQLAELNYHRNQEWEADHNSGITRQAVFAFKGDVYQGLQADEWVQEDMAFAEKHLLILSGLYGILRPNHLIKPYRLEMGTPLPVYRSKNLYEFWKKTLKEFFKKEIPADAIVLNLASDEYFKAVQTAEPKQKIINTTFKDYKNGQFKVISFFAKKARGLLANYLIQNKISNIEEIKEFNNEGYYFDPVSSTTDNYTFLRENR